MSGVMVAGGWGLRGGGLGDLGFRVQGAVSAYDDVGTLELDGGEHGCDIRLFCFFGDFADVPAPTVTRHI
jgi:hypothetical protein